MKRSPPQRVNPCKMSIASRHPASPKKNAHAQSRPIFGPIFRQDPKGDHLFVSGPLAYPQPTSPNAPQTYTHPKLTPSPPQANPTLGRIMSPWLGAPGALASAANPTLPSPSARSACRGQWWNSCDARSLGMCVLLGLLLSLCCLHCSSMCFLFTTCGQGSFEWTMMPTSHPLKLHSKQPGLNKASTWVSLLVKQLPLQTAPQRVPGTTKKWTTPCKNRQHYCRPMLSQFLAKSALSINLPMCVCVRAQNR